MATDNSSTQSNSGISQSPFGRLIDAVGSENLPGFPGTGSQSSGGNSQSGGFSSVSPFDQIRTNIDSLFPPGGGTPNISQEDINNLNPFTSGGNTQSGSSFSANPLANQIDTTRADLTNSITEQVYNGSDTNSIEGKISSAVNNLVTSGTSSSTDAGNAYTESVSPTDSVFPQQPLTQSPDNSQAQITITTNTFNELEGNTDNSADFVTAIYGDNTNNDLRDAQTQISNFASLLKQYGVGNNADADDVTVVRDFLNAVSAGDGYSDRSQVNTVFPQISDYWTNVQADINSFALW
ncbi:MAG: hypothetical protein ACREPR_05380 [Brasilonema sp.]